MTAELQIPSTGFRGRSSIVPLWYAIAAKLLPKVMVGQNRDGLQHSSRPDASQKINELLVLSLKLSINYSLLSVSLGGE